MHMLAIILAKRLFLEAYQLCGSGYKKKKNKGIFPFLSTFSDTISSEKLLSEVHYNLNVGIMTALDHLVPTPHHLYNDLCMAISNSS